MFLVDVPEFWQNFVNFMFVNDGTGIAYIWRIVIALGILIISFIVSKIFTKHLKKSIDKKRGTSGDLTTRYFSVSVIRFFFWLAIGFVIVAALNLNVAGAAGIASGITVALGLALQDLICAFAYGLLMVKHKNFQTDDYISITSSVGNCEGVVLKIEVFFTHLRTYDGQEVSISNSYLAKGIITNYSKLGRRRLTYKVPVCFEENYEKVKTILIKIISEQKEVLKDPAPVFSINPDFLEYGYEVQIRLWMKFVPDDDYWNVYLYLNEKVIKEFQKNNIKIARRNFIDINAKKDN